MALYAIGDLHLCLGAPKPMDVFGGLCLGAPKPMDVFGGAWVGYMDKLRQGLAGIGPEDTTVLLGDLSWALDPGGLCLDQRHPRQENHPQGKPRLLVEHQRQIPEVLRRKRI